MKKLTEFSVKYPVTVFMVVLAVCLLGYISYDKLGVDLFPDLNSPKIFVEIEAGERPPEEIEKQFVENIEATAIRQSDVLRVTSVSKVGSAQITVEYDWDKDMDEAFLDLQKALNTLTQNSDIDELNITQHDPNTSPVMIIGLTHERIKDMNELRKSAENYIRNELIRLEGIAEVELSGEEESEVVIRTDPYRLESQDLTMDDISGKIDDFNTSVSGGTISEMGMQYIVKGVSLLSDVEDFENLIVGYKSVKEESDDDDETTTKAPIFLKDVADVSFQNKEPDNIVHINGERCIGLSVYKETKYNTVKAVEQTKKALVDIEKALPGYKLTMVSNQGTFISQAISEVKESALLGILLAVIVLFIFLRRFGTTLIIAIAIPVSIVATFILMYFNDLSVNIMTLGGLALGAGMLVDNAIVVMENIFRNHENGMSVRDSAVIGTSQVGGAITSSTLTTIVVFLPIVYLHGASGELFKDQAWTVAFSLLSSLFVAIFLIPMLYHRFYRNKALPVKHKSVKVGGYGRFLGNVLTRKWLVILLAAILVGGACLLFPHIGTAFMPKTETKEFNIDLRLQEGTELERTNATTKNIEALLREYLGDNLEMLYSEVGPSGTGSDENSVFEGENTASIKVKLKDKTPISTEKVIETIDKQLSGIEGLEVTFSQEETALSSILGTDEAPVVVEVKGEELDEIETIVNQVKDKMQGVKGLFNVQSSIEDGAPEVEITVDRIRAGLYGIDVSSVISQLEDQLQGTDAGELEKDGEMQDIVIKIPEKGLNELNNMTITSDDEVFRLNEIATISYGVSPKEIYRRNQNRIGKVTAQLEDGYALDRVAGNIRKATSSIKLKSEYRITVTGEEEKRQESMSSLGFALLLSIVLVYMVMAAQFESLIHPFTILLTIPLAVVGSIVTFFVLGQSLNIMSIIGIIMLVGIAVNDSIILVDRINQLIREGMERKEAIMLAGQQRIRPIIMTSLTTILALVPLTIGFGESASLRSPMALAVIGGLVTSTLLTLIVIPCVYDVFDRLKDVFVKKR